MQSLSYLQSLLKYSQTDSQFKKIVFYSEGKNYWVHLKPIVEALVGVHNQKISYVSSEPDDPGLEFNREMVRGFVIGDRLARTYFFKSLDAAILVMTMPDLETFHIKRSVNAVHYVYVHHSVYSSHMVYNHGAFDAFDSIFCVGPHHKAETLAAEKLYGLKKKRLFDHGYGRLDTIASSDTTIEKKEKIPTILVAPSWGPSTILEYFGAKFIDIIADEKKHVIIRPHPMTVKRCPHLITEIIEKSKDNKLISVESGVASTESLFLSDAMVSDWSGASLDYAFGLEKPVLFVDLPLKINNPKFEELKIPPLEIGMRERLGEVLSPMNIGDIHVVLDRLVSSAHYKLSIRRLRQDHIYNFKRSGTSGARHLINLLEEIENCE